jgi:hypothetical protein
VRVHLAREHAAELEAADRALVTLHLGRDRIDRGGVALLHRHGEQVAGVGDALGELIDGADDALELRPLTAQGLRPLGLAPDLRVLELAQYFGQAFLLAGVVKDTP